MTSTCHDEIKSRTTTAGAAPSERRRPWCVQVLLLLLRLYLDQSPSFIPACLAKATRMTSGQGQLQRTVTGQNTCMRYVAKMEQQECSPSFERDEAMGLVPVSAAAAATQVCLRAVPSPAR
eukprot:GHVU01219956.1.p1 GENE.GHVU01219956.1~~GHVU01219956.1.p1  ORF type:complete len:121 (-),score=10.96 GHVU01219956.1:288-650(-)